jgi:hypothetical protein
MAAASLPRKQGEVKQSRSLARPRDLAAPARVFAEKSYPLISEGAGNAGRRCARSRAWCVVSTRVSHHGHTENTRHSPRNGFTVSFVLFPVIGLVVTVAGDFSPT